MGRLQRVFSVAFSSQRSDELQANDRNIIMAISSLFSRRCICKIGNKSLKALVYIGCGNGASLSVSPPMSYGTGSIPPKIAPHQACCHDEGYIGRRHLSNYYNFVPVICLSLHKTSFFLSIREVESDLLSPKPMHKKVVTIDDYEDAP